MKAKYPNLELIEERFKNSINSYILKARAKSDKQFFCPDFKVNVFKQTFPNTSGIFQTGGAFSGQAITDQYITVIHERDTDLYGVYGENRAAYILRNPTDEFFHDLSARHMKTIEESGVYIDTKDDISVRK